jgi:hypothetical protein
MTDVPTLTSTTAANYCVLNPLNYGQYTAPTPFTSTNGNLSWTYTRSTYGQTWGVGTIAIPSSGKIYFEVCQTAYNSVIGLTVGVASIALNPLNPLPSIFRAIELYSGNKYSDSVFTAYGTGYTLNDIVGCAIDLTTGKIFFSKNGIWQGSSDPVTGTNAAFTDLVSSGYVWIPALIGSGGDSNTGWVNFGQRPFAYTPPSGFVALNAYNLPAGTITTSGTFTGNASADGPSIYLNGVPTAMTINGNAVTWGTHADKTAYGFKIRTASASYNASGSNTYSVTTTGAKLKYANAQGNP